MAATSFHLAMARTPSDLHMDLPVSGESKLVSELPTLRREGLAAGARAIPKPGKDEAGEVVGREAADLGQRPVTKRLEFLGIRCSDGTLPAVGGGGACKI